MRILRNVVSADSIAWHRTQFDAPKRSTIHLREFVARIWGADEMPGDVLDAACGAGANMLHLSELWPSANWTGIDLDEAALELARERLDAERFTLVAGNLNRLEAEFGPKRFDVCFSIMSLSWLDDYERAIEQMLAVTRKWLFVLNLFSRAELDAFTRVVGRMAGSAVEGYDAHYNVYSLPRFERYCRDLGARHVEAEPFEIDLDLPPTNGGGMGTFTERTADGRRLQFSGPVWMPWWFVAVEL